MEKKKVKTCLLTRKIKKKFYKINLAWDSEVVLTFKFMPTAMAHIFKTSAQKIFKVHIVFGGIS